MKSIRSKIMLSIILIVFVSLAVVGGVSTYLNYTSTLDTLEITMQETAIIAAERVSHELQSYMNIATEVGQIQTIANPSASVAEKQRIVNQRVQAYGLQRGNLIGADGISLFDGKDYSDREYYQEAMQGRPHVSEPLVSKITGELAIMIGAPVWKEGVYGSEVVGCVYFVPKESFLIELVSSVKVSDNGSAQIIDNTGSMVAHPDIEQVKNKTNSQELEKTDASYHGLAALEAKQVRGESGFGFYKFGGVKRFLAYAPIENSDGWSIGVNAPISDFTKETVLGMVLTGILLLVSLGVSAAVAVTLAQRIARPMQMCAERLTRLSEGDLETSVPESKLKDETGVLLGSLGQTVKRLNDMVGEIERGLGQIAAGNVAISFEQEFHGDFAPIGHSIRKIITNLDDTLGKINQSSSQVANGAEQVSGGAQALSQGATEQASSVQELAATINEISSHVKANAENAREASGIVSEAGRMIQESNGQMDEMVAAISEISQKSADIGKIIKTIEDIAFQTNILALNAAVEAARAGAAGKGFAVVADEVRSLASKSGEAAKNTTGLIESTIRAVENGTRIAGDTAASLREIVGRAQAAVDSVDQISKASGEQAQSIAQITTGIDQISAVVQTNSATAEESAAASEELSSQAQVLKSLVGRFQLSGSINGTAYDGTLPGMNETVEIAQISSSNFSSASDY